VFPSKRADDGLSQILALHRAENTWKCRLQNAKKENGIVVLKKQK
jgi:hypothetical protein